MNESYKDLSPVELLDCRAKPFGYAIKDAYVASGAPDNDLNVLAKASDLRKRVSALVNDESPAFRNAVRNANVMYAGTDKLSADNPWYDHDNMPHGTLQWLATASDTEVVQFALWNTSRQIKFQTKLSKQQPMLEAETIRKTKSLIDMNVFPKNAADHVRVSIGHYGTILAMDAFESGLESTNGYTNDRIIALANNYDLPWDMDGINQEMISTTFHEYLHGTKMGGAGTFMNGLTSGNEIPFRILEEPYVTHATEITRDPRLPQPEVINPYERYNGNIATYVSERHLLSIICAEDAANIPIDLLSEAYFDQLNSNARRTLEKKLKKFFTEIDDNHNDDALYEFANGYEATHMSSRGNKNSYVENYLSALFAKQGIESTVEDEMMRPDSQITTTDDKIIFDFTSTSE
ncbi:MAG: hypothetical protein JWM07_574 [Candidatus Saccharibacteria bacterium]|nr:hypothetical protein [Candidatus Saccharibacteria bacterium]